MKVTRSPYSLRISGNSVWCMREQNGHSRSSKFTNTTLDAFAPRVGRPLTSILLIVSAKRILVQVKIVSRFREERSLETRNVRSCFLSPLSTVTVTEVVVGKSGLGEALLRSLGHPQASCSRNAPGARFSWLNRVKQTGQRSPNKPPAKEKKNVELESPKTASALQIES